MMHLYESRTESIKAAALLRELSQPQRIMILISLSDGLKKVSDIELETKICQPALSQQLCRLRKSGFVIRTRRSRDVYYAISNKRSFDCVNLIKIMSLSTKYD